MKKKYKLLFSILVLAFCLYTVDAQDAKATINDQFIIELTEMPVNDSYVIDISSLPFTSKSQAKDLFTKASTPVASYQVDYDKKELTVNLNLKHGTDQNWELADWNRYFAYLSKRMLATYQQVE